MNWIAVKDRKPLHRQQVLGYNKGQYFFCRWDEKHKIWLSLDHFPGDYGEDTDVTYWMSLPEKPDNLEQINV